MEWRYSRGAQCINGDISKLKLCRAKPTCLLVTARPQCEKEYKSDIFRAFWRIFSRGKDVEAIERWLKALVCGVADWWFQCGVSPVYIVFLRTRLVLYVWKSAQRLFAFWLKMFKVLMQTNLSFTFFGCYFKFIFYTSVRVLRQ